MTLQRPAYSAVPVVDDDKAFEELSAAGEPTTASPESSYRPWLVHLSILSLYTIAFLAIFVYLFVQKMTERPTETCFLEQSTYSHEAPAHQAVEYTTIRFDGSLEAPSLYKGYPSPALEDAWDRITTNGSFWPIRISNEDLDKINKAGRASNVRYSEADGGGSMGTIEVFHQLHCLNVLRKYTYPKEYPELQDLWKTRPKFIRSHLDHCIDIIRQSLMCASDVGVISYDWLGGWNKPFPDLDTYHKCRNFEAVLDWITRNRVHIPQDHMRRIGDEVDLPEWHPAD